MKKMSAEYRLDQALSSGERIDESELSGLLDVRERLRQSFSAESGGGRRERVMFLGGVAARRRDVSPVGRLAWVAAVLVLLFTMNIMGRTALPGQALYPVRQVLHSVGLAASLTEVADEGILAARGLVASGEKSLGKGRANAALTESRAAIVILGNVRDLLAHLGGGESASRLISVQELEDRAFAVVAAIIAEKKDTGTGGTGMQAETGEQTGSGDPGRIEEQDGASTGEEGEAGEQGEADEKSVFGMGKQGGPDEESETDEANAADSGEESGTDQDSGTAAGEESDSG